jgi:hypothetical protein
MEAWRGTGQEQGMKPWGSCEGRVSALTTLTSQPAWSQEQDEQLLEMEKEREMAEEEQVWFLCDNGSNWSNRRRGHRLRDTWVGHTHGPSSRFQSVTRYGWIHTPEGPQSHPIKEEGFFVMWGVNGLPFRCREVGWGASTTPAWLQQG